LPPAERGCTERAPHIPRALTTSHDVPYRRVVECRSVCSICAPDQEAHASSRQFCRVRRLELVAANQRGPMFVLSHITSLTASASGWPSGLGEGCAATRGRGRRR